MPGSSAANVRVCVRIRKPFREGEKCSLECDPRAGNVLKLPSGEEKSYQIVLGPDASQHDAYVYCGEPLVDALLSGQRACLFAYGQTGSGKTFSMFGAEGGKMSKLDGIVPLLVAELFRRISKMESETVCEFRCSVNYLEVQNTKVLDLLTEKQSSDGLKTRSSDTGLEVLGATTTRVQSARALTQIIEKASKRRATAANSMHEHSSRSHAYLTLHLERRTPESSQSTKINLIDLAGSETFDSSGSGSGAGINTGLLALGKVLAALADKKPHIPFRDSVLTRLLQGPLGGNSVTTMLACINPSKDHIGESQSTLRYASRAASVVNATELAKVNVLLKSADPMGGDKYDENEAMNRRVETIETRRERSSDLRRRANRDSLLQLPEYGLARRREQEVHA